MEPKSLDPTIVTQLAVLFIVVRLALRELRPRSEHVGRMWIRPGFIGFMALLLLVGGAFVPNVSYPLLALVSVVCIAGGAGTGLAVSRLSRYERSEKPGRIIVRGSVVTAAIWLAAVALRFAARFAFAPPHAVDKAVLDANSLTLNVGVVLWLAVAYAVVSLGISRAMATMRGPSGAGANEPATV